MVLGIMAVLVMGLVVAMGAVLMELLFRDAPRRGKRPDVPDDSPNSRTVLRVTTTDGESFVGPPLEVVRELIAEGYAPATGFLTPWRAEHLLPEWERQGIVRIRGEWQEV
ncbi:MAG: hypothetical protein SFU56_12285 [Capsulimonadales bacterium]|nr:hypothetical protein [Capsulimonadales bacterium]